MSLVPYVCSHCICRSVVETADFFAAFEKVRPSVSARDAEGYMKLQNVLRSRRAESFAAAPPSGGALAAL